MVRRESLNVFLTLFAAVLSAFGLHVFVYPANFAPSGMDGVATMLQNLTGWNAGYYSLLLNLPLLAAAWFVLKRRYAIYTLLFMVISSLLVVLLGKVEFYQYISASDYLISAIFSGLILGFRTGIMLKLGASTGGADIIACMIRKRREDWNVERILCIICYGIVGLSYFVYRDLNCILLSVVQTFVYEKIAAAVLKDTRSAVEFKIVTKEPNTIRDEIILRLGHGATIVDARGMFSEEENYVVLVVVNCRQIADFFDIIKKTFGNFCLLLGSCGCSRKVSVERLK